jgi:hypothetical protein
LFCIRNNYLDNAQTQSGALIFTEHPCPGANWIERIGVRIIGFGTEMDRHPYGAGDPALLDDIRRQFAERLRGFENNLYEAAGILLQLLLGTLVSALEVIDTAAQCRRAGRPRMD